MELLRAIYIGATIFGASVTLADLFGLLASSDSSDAEDGSDGALGESDSDASGAAGDAGNDAASGSGDDGSESGDDESGGSIVGHDRKMRGNLVLTLLAGLRTLVYFSLGFGPVGWFATTQYQGVASTLLWSVPVGLIVAAGTRALRYFMRKDLTSTITRADLMMERGVVTVSIAKGQAGRVRIAFGKLHIDRFARSSDEKESMPVGTAIRVVDVDEEYVYVESEDS